MLINDRSEVDVAKVLFQCYKTFWASHISVTVTESSFRLQATLEVTQANMQYRLLSASPSELRLELLPRTTQQSLQPLHLSVTMTTENRFHLQVKRVVCVFWFVLVRVFICDSEQKRKGVACVV